MEFPNSKTCNGINQANDWPAQLVFPVPTYKIFTKIMDIRPPKICNLTARCSVHTLRRTIMKTKILSLTIITSVMGTASLLAVTSPQALSTPTAPAAQFQTIRFSDTAEAGMLHHAYRILAYGDHDYKGHRAAAMKQVKAAADLLGVDLSGDDRDRKPQVLSDDELRQARGLLTNVLGASEVKGQDRISRHINAAIKQIDIALAIR
jgi:hypothetical protein